MRKILITSIAVIASLNILAQGYRWALCFLAFMPTQVCVLTALDTASLYKVNIFVVAAPCPCKVAHALTGVGPSG